MSPTSTRAACAAGAVIHSDGRRGYDGLGDVGYQKHFRVSHGDNEFANDESHLDGSWERRMQAS
jgi:transposase